MYINPIIANRYSYAYNNKNVRKTANVQTPDFKANDFEKYAKNMHIELTNCFYGGRCVGKHSSIGYIEVLKGIGKNIKDYLTITGESAVFTDENGNIIKISCDNYHSYIPKYHAPEIERGEVITSKEYEIDYPDIFSPKTTNHFYYIIQKKGMMHVNETDIKKFIESAVSDGYKFYDLKPEQFAYFDINGKREVRLVDMGCLYEKDEKCEYD